MASASATYAPVMAAVRVPPSACRTSQSSTIVFSPNALVSTTERRLRPMSREISCVRPPMRPLTDSRSERVLVARGSIAYSAVTQPWPLPLRQRGTPGVNDAAHSTRVRPNSTRTLPSAWSSQPRVIRTSRSWSTARPSGRRLWSVAGVIDMGLRLDVVGRTGPGDVQRAVPHLPRLGQADRGVVPGRAVGEHQPPDPARPDDALGGPASGQVHARRLVTALDVGAVGEHQVGVPAQRGERVAGVGVAGVGQHAAVLLHPQAV